MHFPDTTTSLTIFIRGEIKRIFYSMHDRALCTFIHLWTRNFLLNLIFNLICSVVSFRDILPFSSLFFFSIPLTSCENYWQENNNWKVQRVKWNRVKSTKYSAVFNVFSNPFGTSDLFPRNERSMPENESNPLILTLNNLTILFFFFFFL